MDLNQLIVESVVFPATITLRPVGNEVYALYFDGELEFRLFDPVFNLPLGTYRFDLDGFDNRRGLYYRYSTSQPFGVFVFDDWAGFYAPALGSTSVAFSFDMAPQGRFLGEADTAVLNWSADLYGQGGVLPYVVPSEAHLRGTATVAVRIDG